jgi:hypothetical protein
MLTIRDEEVRTLARELMQKTGAATMTAAVKSALVGELSRTDEHETLLEKIAAIREKALAGAVRPPQPPMTKEERDHLWER